MYKNIYISRKTVKPLYSNITTRKTSKKNHWGGNDINYNKSLLVVTSSLHFHSHSCSARGAKFDSPC